MAGQRWSVLECACCRRPESRWADARQSAPGSMLLTSAGSGAAHVVALSMMLPTDRQQVRHRAWLGRCSIDFPPSFAATRWLRARRSWDAVLPARHALSRCRTILEITTACRGIAPDLARYGRSSAPKPGRNLAYAMPLNQQQRDLLALCRRQVSARQRLGGWPERRRWHPA